MERKCSLGLNTRVKDKRNFLANCSYDADCKRNIIYNEEDDKKKCEIFNIPNTRTDFITREPMKGIGDHLYPLVKDFVVKKIIGSDSLQRGGGRQRPILLQTRVHLWNCCDSIA